MSDSGVVRKYSSDRLASPAPIRPLVHHAIVAVGTTTSQKDMKICMRILAASSTQIGDAVLAGVRCALELRAATAEASRSSFPHLLGTHIAENGREWSDPAPAAHCHTIGNGGPHADLAAALEVNTADVQVLPRPSRCLNVGSSLDGDIIVDADQIQRTGQESIMRALKVIAHSGTELSQHECHKRRAAIHQTQSEQHSVLQPANAPDP